MDLNNILLKKYHLTEIKLVIFLHVNIKIIFNYHYCIFRLKLQTNKQTNKQK